jgi:hypothetical protein
MTATHPGLIFAFQAKERKNRASYFPSFTRRMKVFLKSTSDFYLQSMTLNCVLTASSCNGAFK